MKKVIKLSLFLLIFFIGLITNQPVLAGVDYNNYNNCNYHAYKLCSGNRIYWYDSCGNQQDLYQDCSYSNLTCRYGQCVYSPSPQPTYITHYSKKCSDKHIYWYDSVGVKNDLYKNCSDSNSCTFDTCSGTKCSNILKCDGTTCSSGSADYQTYCQAAQPQNQEGQNLQAISVLFFAKQDLSSTQWQKNIQIGSNGTAHFMISVANNGADLIDNLTVSVNIPNDFFSLGNVKINETAVSGDIVSGISLGSLSQGSAKTITFEGKTQNIAAEGVKKATATITVNGTTKSDSIDVNLVPGQQTPDPAPRVETFGFWEFIKRWYLWILIGLVLIFLFVVIFRRLSSNT